MNAIVRLLYAGSPLFLAVLFAGLVMEGYVSLGSGDKDIFLLPPLLLWAIVYTVCYGIFRGRRVAPRRSVAKAAGVATAFVVAGWLILVAVVLV